MSRALLFALWKTFPEEALQGPRDTVPTTDPYCEDIVLSAVLPGDVSIDPRSAGKRAQRLFDCLSWRTFVALNWPRDPDARGVPDPKAKRVHGLSCGGGGGLQLYVAGRVEPAGAQRGVGRSSSARWRGSVGSLYTASSGARACGRGAGRGAAGR